MHGGGTESVLWTAWCSLLAFAAVGYVIGWVAGKTVEQSVHGRIMAELAAAQPAETPRPSGSAAASP
jgi:hypothetical protein